MSELTSCNYCTFQYIKQCAKDNKQKVTKVSKGGGINILVDGEFRCWFMKLTSHCVC